MGLFLIQIRIEAFFKENKKYNSYFFREWFLFNTFVGFGETIIVLIQKLGLNWVGVKLDWHGTVCHLPLDTIFGPEVEQKIPFKNLSWLALFTWRMTLILRPWCGWKKIWLQVQVWLSQAKVKKSDCYIFECWHAKLGGNYRLGGRIPVFSWVIRWIFATCTATHTLAMRKPEVRRTCSESAPPPAPQQSKWE